MKIRRRALVLQGGGALGAYAYGAIRALYEQPDFSPDVVTGVSIGAINAAVLVGAKQDPIRALDELWRERLAIRDWRATPPMLTRYASVLANPAMYRIRLSYVYSPLLAPFLETSIYDTAPLRQTLADLIDLNRLNRSEIHLAVSTVNVETGETTYFENRDEVPLSIEHIVASGSLAPDLPMTNIKDQRTGEGRWYWDGGFASNLPLSQLDCIQRREMDREDKLGVRSRHEVPHACPPGRPSSRPTAAPCWRPVRRSAPGVSGARSR